MTKKFLYLISILIILTVAACGPAATPTLNLTDIQNAALTQAWIAMTMTQAALPTATITPIPLSPTPFPTFVSLPTLPSVVATAVPPTNPADACNQVPPQKPQGALVQVEFVNKTGARVNLSFGMNTPNDQGECVTYTFVLGDFQILDATVLAGCYWGYGWVYTNPSSTSRTPSLICLSDPNKIPPVWIQPEVMYLH